MYGEGERSRGGGLVLCKHSAVSCAAAPLPLGTAFGSCGAAGAVTAQSRSYMEGENCLPSM